MNWAESDEIKKRHQADLARVKTEAKSLVPGGAPKLKIKPSGAWEITFRLGGEMKTVVGTGAEAVLLSLRTLVKAPPPRVMG